MFVNIPNDSTATVFGGVFTNKINIDAYRRVAAEIAREAAEGIAAQDRKHRNAPANTDCDYDLELKRIQIERQRLCL